MLHFDTSEAPLMFVMLAISAIDVDMLVVSAARPLAIETLMASKTAAGGGGEASPQDYRD